MQSWAGRNGIQISNFKDRFTGVYSLSCIQLFSYPMDCSPPGSTVHGILQERILEWVANSFSRADDSSILKQIFSLGHFPHSSVGKESAFNAGDLGLIPGSGSSPAEGNGNPLQYSCLENPLDRGAWQATVHGVARVACDLVTKWWQID